MTKLLDDALIDSAGHQPAGKSGRPRFYCAISSHGSIRLQEETQRLAHAVKIANCAGVNLNPIPTDIQRLMLESIT